MAFTQVTISHNYDLPSSTGALGAVEFALAAAMHNAGKTVYGPRRAVLAGDGTISIPLEATTDPGTWPTGVRYRVTERITGLPARVYYVSVPHDLGAALDLDTLIASAGATSATVSGSGFAYAPVTLTAVSGVITPNAALGYGPHRYTAIGNITLAEPTGGSDGEPIEVQVYASTADRVLTVAGATITITSGTYWWGHYSYDAARTTWILDDAGSGAQPVDADLTALGNLADGVPVRTAGTWGLATGIRDGTHYLRDDGTWQTVAGGSGISPTIVDAKGDLIAATAADTVARFPAGSNGQVLRANSATSTGLEYAALAVADITGLQAALDAKAAATVAINAQAGSYTLVLADAGRAVHSTSATGVTYTVPPNSSVAFPTGTVILAAQMAAGQITIAAGAGVTLRTASSATARAQYSEISLRKVATDEWLLAGDLT